jgi:integrase
VVRRKSDSAIDLGRAHDLTAGLIGDLTCPRGMTQAFMRDTLSPGLRVRVTPTGAKSFVFEGKLNRRTIRQTIGDARSWAIPKARVEANRLRVLLDSGVDPRELERERLNAVAAKREADRSQTATVGSAWDAYVTERRPQWGDLHYRDHVRKASPGGVKSARGTRGTGVTQPGPLHSLMRLKLNELTPSVVDAWAAREANTRPSSARLAWRLLKVFLEWCSQHATYAPLLPEKNPAKTTKARESLGRAAAKSDVLQREQLGVWFTNVQQLPNPVIAAALQVMLLTGARPGEVLTLRREDVNTKWKGLTIRDKVEGLRVIPLNPYVAQLLSNLPVQNEWVFSSPSSASGHLTEPNSPHTRACIAAGLQGLTLHGLRRSFASLTEWLDVPAGVVAQIMGHKPSATAERHYKVRPLELLAVHHRRIETWILEQAAVSFDETTALRSIRAAA